MSMFKGSYAVVAAVIVGLFLPSCALESEDDGDRISDDDLGSEVQSVDGLRDIKAAQWFYVDVYGVYHRTSGGWEGPIGTLYLSNNRLVRVWSRWSQSTSASPKCTPNFTRLGYDRESYVSGYSETLGYAQARVTASDYYYFSLYCSASPYGGWVYVTYSW